MTEEYRKILELLPTANREEIKIMADLLYHIIDNLEESIKHLVKSKDERTESLKELVKTKDERIAFLEEWLKDKDKEIERLRLQVQTNEFNRLFVFGKVGMGKA